MKTDVVRALTETFEGHAQHTDAGVEYWLGRDVQHLLGYAEWRNFGLVLSKAKTACELSGHLAGAGWRLRSAAIRCTWTCPWAGSY